MRSVILAGRAPSDESGCPRTICTFCYCPLQRGPAGHNGVGRCTDCTGIRDRNLRVQRPEPEPDHTYRAAAQEAHGRRQKEFGPFL